MDIINNINDISAETKEQFNIIWTNNESHKKLFSDTDFVSYHYDKFARFKNIDTYIPDNLYASLNEIPEHNLSLGPIHFKPTDIDIYLQKVREYDFQENKKDEIRLVINDLKILIGLIWHFKDKSKKVRNHEIQNQEDLLKLKNCTEKDTSLFCDAVEFLENYVF